MWIPWIIYNSLSHPASSGILTKHLSNIATFVWVKFIQYKYFVIFLAYSQTGFHCFKWLGLEIQSFHIFFTLIYSKLMTEVMLLLFQGRVWLWL